MPEAVERPEWLTEAYLQDVYRDRSEFKGKKCDVEILKCSGVVEVGDNYLSKMYRIRVKVSGGDGVSIEDNLIVKSLEHTNPMMLEAGIFAIEKVMYKDILPAFDKLWKEVGVDVQFGPKCLKAEEKPFHVLILSDLNQDNYFMEDRFEKLGLKHAEITLAKLAKFHAASVVYKERNKSFGELLERKYFDPKMAFFFSMLLETNNGYLAAALEKMNIDPIIVDKVRKWPDTFLEEMYRITDPEVNPGDFHVLSHADLWLNNQLYRRNKDGQPDDVIFVDFQISYWGNPITDIFYYLFTSVQPDVVVANFDYFISFYHSNLVESLATLKAQQKGPTLKQLHAQVLRNGFFVTSLFSEIMAAVVMDRNKDANIDSLIGIGDADATKKMREQMYNNPRYEKAVKILLPFLDNKGFLDSGMKKGDLPEAFKQGMKAAAEQFAQMQQQMSAPVNGNAAKVQPPQQQTEVVTNGFHAKSKVTKRIADSISQLTQANSKSSGGPRSVDNAMTPASPADSGPPAWLDKFYFYDILRKYDNTFRVVTFQIAPANKKGENYASVMYRVKIKVETSGGGLKDRDFVLKINPSTGMSAEMMEAFNVFPKEIEMYNTMIPTFEALYRAVGETVQFGPRCVLGGKEPVDIIILEDLKPAGYVNAKRQELLDLQHCELTLEKLAKFHAASVLYVEKEGSFPKRYDNGIYSESMREMFKHSYQSSLTLFQDIVKDWKCGDILKKAFSSMESLMDKLFTVVKRDEHRFNVLCHGDMWANNIMFKYDEAGKPTDCLLVDFQMCYYNSPVMDLLYFIFTSPKQSIKLSHIDHFLQFYHTHLVRNLKSLGYKKPLPTLLQLQVDFLEKGYFGFNSAFGTFAIVVADGGDDADMENFMKDDEVGRNFKRRIFSNPIFVSAMEEVVPYFARKGYFE